MKFEPFIYITALTRLLFEIVNGKPNTQKFNVIMQKFESVETSQH